MPIPAHHQAAGLPRIQPQASSVPMASRLPGSTGTMVPTTATASEQPGNNGGDDLDIHECKSGSRCGPLAAGRAGPGRRCGQSSTMAQLPALLYSLSKMSSPAPGSMG